MQLQAYPGDPAYDPLLLADFLHWGSHVEVLNSQTNIWLASSLVECSQEAGVRSTAEICLFRGALLQDGENTGQVSTVHYIFFSPKPEYAIFS
jgi:hypothetical protein